MKIKSKALVMAVVLCCFYTHLELQARRGNSYERYHNNRTNGRMAKGLVGGGATGALIGGMAGGGRGAGIGFGVGALTGLMAGAAASENRRYDDYEDHDAAMYNSDSNYEDYDTENQDWYEETAQD